MGPLEKTKPWSTNGVKGVYSFLNRAYRFFGNPENHHHEVENNNLNKLLHKTIKKVTEDLNSYKFNTPLSQMMIFTNEAIKVGRVSVQTIKEFAKILSPYAPHLGEELWEISGAKSSLAYEPWPNFDPNLTQDDLLVMAVQVNGKTRGTFEVNKDISKEDFFDLVKADEKISKYISEGEMVKEIFVPGKICNFVVRLKK